VLRLEATEERFSDETAQVPESVLQGGDLECLLIKEVEGLRPPVSDMKGAAGAAGEIERPQEILPRKELEGRRGAGAQDVFMHRLRLQDQ
jgi:hypothetical protein